MGAAELLVVVGLLLAVVIVAAFVWWVMMLVQAIKTPDEVWNKAGHSKILYVLLMVLLGVLGTILYVVVARPALRNAGAEA